MRGRRLIIEWAVQNHASGEDGSEVLSLSQLADEVRSRAIFRRLWRYREVEFRTCRPEAEPKPLALCLLLRALSRGRCWIAPEHGLRQRVTVVTIAGRFLGLIRDLLTRRATVQHHGRNVTRLRAGAASAPSLVAINSGARPSEATCRLDLAGRPVYLRTDLLFALQSGGSVGHIAGVLNNLDRFTGPPILLTTDTIPTVRDDIESHLVLPTDRFKDFAWMPAIHFNDTCEHRFSEFVGRRPVAFVYQRYSTFNYAGFRLAQALRVPFILEYNGSEVWIGKHWGQALPYESLAAEIELLNLAGADVVVVVSEASRDELLERGVNREAILVNPNGVDIQRYSPQVDGSRVRAKHGLDGKLVLGFIGTFGRWHGAEVLADAFGRLLGAHPDLRSSVRLLMIGDGLTMPQVKEQLHRHGVADLCVLTGQIPQQDGPSHLAACDVLVSPHVPNPDGTRFFGSPTKLFEYMAMGKGIVASDLEQIGQVLKHDQTAWLVKPGDPDALTDGLNILIRDPQRRARLGQAAREAVSAQYTWEQHTRRIIEKLKERCG